MSSEPYLHVYPHGSWHMPVRVVGNHSGLKALAAAINDALRIGRGTAHVVPGDGEGYEVEIAVADAAGIEKMRLPYVDEFARDDREFNRRTGKAVHP